MNKTRGNFLVEVSLFRDEKEDDVGEVTIEVDCLVSGVYTKPTRDDPGDWPECEPLTYTLLDGVNPAREIDRYRDLSADEKAKIAEKIDEELQDMVLGRGKYEPDPDVYDYDLDEDY